MIIQEFSNPKAKIDLITIEFPSTVNTLFDAHRFHENIKGRICGTGNGYSGYRVTIHDPCLPDLQFIVNEYPETRLLELEVCLDFFLADGTNTPEKLAALHSHFAHALAPYEHEALTKGTIKRKRYDQSSNRLKPDKPAMRDNATTVYWRNWRQDVEVKNYIKTINDGRPVDRHCVRLEVRLNAGACQDTNVDFIGLLPAYAKRLRRALLPYFRLAKGIKPTKNGDRRTERTRSADPAKQKQIQQANHGMAARLEHAFSKQGAAWAYDNGHQIVPDATFNRAVGNALNNLARRLQKLDAPKKVGNYDDWQKDIRERNPLTSVAPGERSQHLAGMGVVASPAQLSPSMQELIDNYRATRASKRRN